MRRDTYQTPVASETLGYNIPFREAFWLWVKVALNSFGGPAGQIAVMYRYVVEEKRWISEQRFLHALNYCMLLPGPEAQQLATYIGWLLHRTAGGLVAGTLFILPGFVSIMALSVLYASYQDVTIVQALFYGIKPAVMAVVVDAVIRIGRRALKNVVMVGIAGLAFIAIFFFNVPFPLIVLSAGLTGYVGGKKWPKTFHVIKGHGEGDAAKGGNDIAIADVGVLAHTRPSRARSIRLIAIFAVLWFGPLIVLLSTLGSENVFVRSGIFFSQMAVVTFGGAYAVLAYVAQQAVETYGWLQPGEMLDGLGMAETTPGPLIQVVQFVGFMATYRQPGTLDPLLAGVLGGVLTTWVTFVPCFLWIFLGAPYIEQLRDNQSLSSTLSGITAAVVGVILNLAVWFSLHTIFEVVDEVHTLGMRIWVPAVATIDSVALLIAVVAFGVIFRLKVQMIPTLLGSALVGLIYYLIFLG